MYETLVNRYYYSLADLADVDTGPGAITNVYTFDALLHKIQPIWATGAFASYEQTMFQQYLWPEFYDSPIMFVDKDQDPFGAEVEPTAQDIEDAELPLLGRMYRWYQESLERYGLIIGAYNTVKAKLLDPVTVTSTGTATHSYTLSGGGTNTGTVTTSETNGSTTNASDSKTHLESDTPQTSLTLVLSAGYVSRAAKDDGTATTTISGSISSTITNDLANSTSSTDNGVASTSGSVADDRDTPIARLAEIEQKLHNVYATWANEFSKFVLHSAE